MQPDPGHRCGDDPIDAEGRTAYYRSKVRWIATAQRLGLAELRSPGKRCAAGLDDDGVAEFEVTSR